MRSARRDTGRVQGSGHGKETYGLLSIPLEALLGPSRANWDGGRPVYRLDRPRWCVVKCCTRCNLVPLPK
jgi:hypothetical protein